LRCSVMRSTNDDEVSPLDGARAKAVDEVDILGQQRLEGHEYLVLLDIVGQITTRHALVDMLETGKGTKLFDPRLHIMAGKGFTLANRIEIDIVDMALVGMYGFGGDLEAEVALGFENCDPEPALKPDLALL